MLSTNTTKKCFRKLDTYTVIVFFCHYSVILSELYSLYVVGLSAEVGTVVPEDVRCKCTHPSSVHLHWLSFMCFTVTLLVVGFVFAGKLALVENMMTMMMVVLVLNQFFVQLLATETLNQRKTGDFAALIVPIFSTLLIYGLFLRVNPFYNFMWILSVKTHNGKWISGKETD